MLRLLFIVVLTQILTHLALTILTPHSEDWLIFIKMMSAVTWLILARGLYRLLMLRRIM